MKMAALLFILTLPGLASRAADIIPSQNLFKVEPIKLRSLPLEPLYVESSQSSFELSHDASRKLEVDMSRFKSMNGRELLDTSRKSDQPTGAIRLLNILYPNGATILGKNPNAPPNRFTH
jgi:hypothetical protein